MNVAFLELFSFTLIDGHNLHCASVFSIPCLYTCTIHLHLSLIIYPLSAQLHFKYNSFLIIWVVKEVLGLYIFHFPCIRIIWYWISCPLTTAVLNFKGFFCFVLIPQNVLTISPHLLTFPFNVDFPFSVPLESWALLFCESLHLLPSGFLANNSYPHSFVYLIVGKIKPEVLGVPIQSVAAETSKGDLQNLFWRASPSTAWSYLPIDICKESSF